MEDYIDMKNTKKLQESGRRFSTVFANDPFVMAAWAFENLYQNQNYEAFIMPEIFDEDGDAVFGRTIFRDDGGIPRIEISAEVPLKHAIEIFAHELAHIATPGDSNHGDRWEKAFEQIYQEYIRIGKEVFEDADIV